MGKAGGQGVCVMISFEFIFLRGFNFLVYILGKAKTDFGASGGFKLI